MPELTRQQIEEALAKAGIEDANLDDFLRGEVEKETEGLKRKNLNLIATNKELKAKVEELNTEKEKFDGLLLEGEEDLDPEEVRAALDSYRSRDKSATTEVTDELRKDLRATKKQADLAAKELEKTKKKLDARSDQVKDLYRERLRVELLAQRAIPETLRGASAEFDLIFREDGDALKGVVIFEGEEMEIKEAVKEWVATPNAKFYLQPRQDIGGGGRGNGSGGGTPAAKKWTDLNLTEQNRLAVSDPKAAQRLAAEAGVTLDL